MSNGDECVSPVRSASRTCTPRIMSFPSDPLEGISAQKDSSCGHLDESLFSDSWREASRALSAHQPSVPSSELSVSSSFRHRRKKKKNNSSVIFDEESFSTISKNDTVSDLGSPRQGPTKSPKELNDPKAAELLRLCHSGWTLSKGQKTKPKIRRANPTSISQDIQNFADRHSISKSKSGSNISVGERIEPCLWPNESTINVIRSKGDIEPLSLRSAKASSTLDSMSYTFPKDIRLHPEKQRSPGPVFDTTSGYQATLKRRSTPMIGAAGRTLLGSIYYDQFNLKSHGNYYHANEAYLNHTSSPAARISPAIVFPRKEKNNNHANVVKLPKSYDPMEVLRKARAKKKNKSSNR